MYAGVFQQGDVREEGLRGCGEGNSEEWGIEVKMRIVKNLKLTYRQEILLVLILMSIGIFIRAYHFGISPVGIHQDEAMAAVDAKALADYGTDRFGMRYPVHFTAWVGGQMSVMLSYFMIPFIKVLGFNIVAIRLPMLIVSSFGLLALYLLGRKIGGVSTGVILLLLGIICPWQYMQSRWSFDCNMFPHMFLFGICFLLAGIEKKWALYVSMVFFALCSYCYGVADYSVPLFLLVTAIYLFRKKHVFLKELIICIGIYFAIALPEFLSMFLTVAKLDSIETPLFTIPSFLQSFRSRDILFANFSWEQLWQNIISTITVVWGNGDKSVTNTIVRFGPLYYATTFLFVLGLLRIILCLGVSSKKESRTADLPEKTKITYSILLFWLLMGIWIGIITRNVTINRINVIFYVVLAISAIGIRWCLKKCRICAVPIAIYYGISALLFAGTYFGAWTEDSRIYYYDSYIKALDYASGLECDYYYISPDPQGEGVNQVGEILTLYSHKIDAHYYQGVSNEQGGKELLPYCERYQYTDVTREIVTENKDKSVVYIVDQERLNLFSEQEYDIWTFYGGYYVISTH